MPTNRRFTLIRRPVGTPVEGDLALTSVPTPELSDGQFLIRNHYASLDPAMRGWMDDKPSYMPPIALGAPISASVLGVVAESRNADFPVGTWAGGPAKCERLLRDYGYDVDINYRGKIPPMCSRKSGRKAAACAECWPVFSI